MLFPNLSVRENILFRLPKRADTVARLQDKLQKLNCQINLDASASTLEVADQQMVEILRGLMREARILILDEPTASLTPGETERLFSQIRALQALDVGIVFISHKLPEIRQLASHISVMRDGAVVLSGETAAYRDEQLINAMTPSQPRPCAERHAKAVAVATGQPPYATAGLSRAAGGRSYSAKALSISIWRSAPERSSVWPGWWDPGAPNLPKPYTACVHRAPGESGWRTARLAATAPAPGWPAGWSICRKTARSRGCFSMRSMRWNTVMFNQPSWWQQGKREAAVVERYHRALGIKLADGDQPVRTLSGGNQQKVLLARCLEANPLLLIVDEPTRGVDVSARADIYQLLKSVAAQNVAVLMISSDLDEFVGLADRVLVMHQGRYSGELARQAVTVDRMMTLAFGGQA